MNHFFIIIHKNGCCWPSSAGFKSVVRTNPFIQLHVQVFSGIIVCTQLLSRGNSSTRKYGVYMWPLLILVWRKNRKFVRYVCSTFSIVIFCFHLGCRDICSRLSIIDLNKAKMTILWGSILGPSMRVCQSQQKGNIVAVLNIYPLRGVDAQNMILTSFWATQGSKIFFFLFINIKLILIWLMEKTMSRVTTPK